MAYKNRTVNNTEGLSAQSTITGKQENVTSTNGALNVDASFSAASVAINDGSNTSLKASVVESTDDSGVYGLVALNPDGSEISGGGGGGGTSSNFGAAFPTAGTAAGASDGTDMQPLLVDGSGNLKVTLPSAVTLSDSLSNPTAPPSGSYLLGWNTTTWERLRADEGDGAPSTGLLNIMGMLYNGSTYDRMPGDKTNGAYVNVKVLPALAAGANAIGTVGTTSAVVNVGQKTVNTSAVQISSSSTVPTNGIIVRALAGNSAPIYVGGSGVTTSTGYELCVGESISFTCNLNTLYIISATSTTDGVCYNVE